MVDSGSAIGVMSRGNGAVWFVEHDNFISRFAQFDAFAIYADSLSAIELHAKLSRGFINSDLSHTDHFVDLAS